MFPILYLRPTSPEKPHRDRAGFRTATLTYQGKARPFYSQLSL